MAYDYEAPQEVESDDVESDKRQTAELKRIQKLGYFGHQLSVQADEQVSKRQAIEERWLRDVTQYLGEYPADEQARLRETGGSQAFMNITRRKVNEGVSRLVEILLPTDDKNWEISPTPMPELEDMKKNDITPLANEFGEPIDRGDGTPMTVGDEAEGIIAEANKRAKLMAREIEDQLAEADYNHECRKMLHDCGVFGTGILKGPIIENRVRKHWSTLPGAPDDDHLRVLKITKETRPGVECIKPWDYFPDMSAINKGQCEYEFHRQYLTRKQMIELADRKGYMKEQIATLVERGPKHTQRNGQHLETLRALSGLTSTMDDTRFELWEYYGPVSVDDLTACECKVDKELEENPLQLMNGVVIFSGNTVIKADINPMEVGDSPFSIMNYEEDEGSIFGYGIPHIIRSQQKITNAAWRMLMDNSGLSVGSQVLVNPHMIKPADGKWIMTPRKIWLAAKPEVDVRSAFGLFDVPNHQNELTAIYEMARQMIDDESELLPLAAGETGGAGAPETAFGTSMMLDRQFTSIRLKVKRFDDDVTKTILRRFYDYNMQFSKKSEIKGDFEIIPKGSTVMLTREIQNQMLMQLGQMIDHPEYGWMLKPEDILRKQLQSQHVVTEEVMLSRDEIEQEKEARANEPPPPDPQMELEKFKAEQMMQIEQFKAEAEYGLAQMKAQAQQQESASKIQIAQLNHQESLIKMGQEREIEVEKLRTMLGLETIKSQTKQKTQEREIQTKLMMGSGL